MELKEIKIINTQHSLKKPICSAEIFQNTRECNTEKNSNRAGQRRLRTETPQNPLLAGEHFVQSGYQELIQILIKYQPKNALEKTIYKAAAAGDERAVRILIQHKADADADKNLILTNAIKSKSLQLVRYLVEEEGCSSGNELKTAISWDCFECFDYFLERTHILPSDIILSGIIAHPNGKRYLDAVNLGSDMQRIRFLLSKGADLTCIKENPFLLSQIIRAGDYECALFLLENGVCKNSNELEWNNHPLFYLLSSHFSGDLKSRITWLETIFHTGYKIDPKFKNDIWMTFDQSILSNKPHAQKWNKDSADIFRELVNGGFPLNEVGMIGPSTLLYYAVWLWKDPDLVESLLKNGVNPNSNNGDPLLFAIRDGNEKIIQLLLRYGAQLDGI